MAEEGSAIQDCDKEVTFCGWFRRLCSAWSHNSHGYDTCREEQEEMKKDGQRNWLVKELREKLKGLKKLKVVLRRTCSCSSGGGGEKKKKKRRRKQFSYDPKSYALNFDDGIEKEQDDDGVSYLDFSARYACPLGINDKEYLGL